jgi:DNA repair ATPase RecN
MDGSIGRPEKLREHKSQKPGFLQSLKLDWSLLLKGLRIPNSWPVLKGKLSGLQFEESGHPISPEERLAQLSEAKKTLNQRIEKINKQLELIKVTLKSLDDSPVVAQLIQDGQKATRELQVLESEISQLRREQKAKFKQILASGKPDLKAR